MNAILEIVQGKEPERYEQQIQKALVDNKPLTECLTLSY